jgi:hypothetical protein
VSEALPQRCPVCRADNDRGPQCRRCRADLGLLFELERQRRGLLGRARNEVARGRPGEALALADEAEALRVGADVQRLRAVAYLVQRDFANAWRSYRPFPEPRRERPCLRPC